MREIKFRSWCDLVDDFAFFKNGQCHYYLQGKSYDKGWHAFDWNDAEQFTGLKDENGVEIYEGDIVRYENPYSQEEFIHIVKWDDLWACFGLFELNNKWCIESDWQKIIMGIEVIGNIHESPELIR